MPKHWGKQIFTLGSFPEVCQNQKTEREKEKKKEQRLNDGDNNGQAMNGAGKPPGPITLILLTSGSQSPG